MEECGPRSSVDHGSGLRVSVCPVAILGACVAAASLDRGARAVAGLGLCAAVGDHRCFYMIAGGCRGECMAVSAVGVRKKDLPA